MPQVTTAKAPEPTMTIKTGTTAFQNAAPKDVTGSNEAAPQAPQTDPKAPSPTEPQIDPRLAQAERSRRQQAREIQRLKFEMNQLKLQAKPQQQQEQPKGWKEQFLANPDYNELNQLILSQPSQENQQLRALQQQVEEAKRSAEESKKFVQDTQTKAYEQAVKQIRNEVTNLVNNDASYEAVKASSNSDAVVALIELTYKEEGIVLSAEDACKQVEEHLVDEYAKMANLGKIRSKLSESTQNMEQGSSPQQRPTTTLTHSSMPVTGGKPMSARERAIQAFLAGKR